MSASTVVWTALPAGIRREGGSRGRWRARVSAFVTPRLEGDSGGDGRLADFPTFLDWASVVRGQSFLLRLRDGSGSVAEVEVRPGSPAGVAPDPGAWSALFHERTPVRAFVPPEPPSGPGRRMLHHDRRQIVGEVRAIYTQALRHEIGELTSPPSPGRFGAAAMPPDGLSVRELLDRWDRTEDPLERFVLFHSRVESRGRGRLGAPTGETLEFHRLVASVGTHPHLLRRLGLVLDFTLPVEALGLDVPAARPCLQVEPSDDRLGDATHVCPWTAVEVGRESHETYRTFTVAHAGWASRRGFLPLGEGRTSVVQEQLEHATFSLIQSHGAERARGRRAAPPALLQGGMRIAHAEEPAALGRAMEGQVRLESWLRARTSAPGTAARLRGAPDEEPLFAEQLVRGYRIDVRDEDEGRWRSLCRRRIRYQADGWSWPERDALEEEGTLEPSVQTDGAEGERVSRAPEDLFEWDGWSLVVPRPGRALDDGATSAEPASPLKAHAEVVPGSLQKQRFGRRYRFRARLVDLAGNSLATDEADDVTRERDGEEVASPPTTSLRVESAKPPVVVRAQLPGPGEGGDLLVLREADDPDHRTSQQRLHVLPPEVPLRLAERHGMFDGMNAGESWRLIREHRGQLPDEHPAPEIPVPYLPDPLVRGALLVLPDGAGVVEMPSFDPPGWEWGPPALARSCSLVLRAGRGPLRARSGGRTVTVDVPRGRVTKIRLAANLQPEHLALLAPCEWLNETDPAAPASRRGPERSRWARLGERAARGDVPLLAPSREITIVHATQRPLTAPRFGRPEILPRVVDSTTATLADPEFGLDAPSTGRVDVYARWEDPVDDPAEEGWRVASREMPAGGVIVPEGERNPLAPADPSSPSRFSHDFGDTRHHEVRYRAAATSRFTDFYPKGLTGEPGRMTRGSAPVVVQVPATAPPAPPEVAYVVPTFRRVSSPGQVEEVGDEHRTVQFGDGLRVFLNRGWFSSGAGERLALVVATAETPPDLREGLSTWGANPLRDAAPLPGPLEMSLVRGGRKRIELWPIGGRPAGLVVHDVHFSEEHGLPFADVEFHPQPSFMPLVRLALARFQEHAIEGCHLSRVIHADFVPLAPGRALTVRKIEPRCWDLALGGFSYAEAGSRSSVVRVHLEGMPKETPEEAAAWRPLGPATLLEPRETAPYHFRWTGQVRASDPRASSEGWRCRLVVRELEPFEADEDVPLEARSRLISAHAVPL